MKIHYIFQSVWFSTAYFMTGFCRDPQRNVWSVITAVIGHWESTALQQFHCMHNMFSLLFATFLA